MPYTIKEAANSRKMREFRRDGRLERTLERRFFVYGGDDPLDRELENVGPQYGEAYDGDTSRNLFVFDRTFQVMMATGESGFLELVVLYGVAERLPQNNGDEPEYEFTTAAQTQHIERALKQDSYPISESTGLIIGATSDKIDGCDIYVPNPAWSQTREIDRLTDGYVQLLTQMTGTINDAPWKFWKAAEVLFTGAKARRRGSGKWRLDFQFVISCGANQLIPTTHGDQEFFKPGWDYMWFSRGQQTAENRIEHVVTAAHVARVYERRNFALLGLGVKVQ